MSNGIHEACSRVEPITRHRALACALVTITMLGATGVARAQSYESAPAVELSGNPDQGLGEALWMSSVVLFASSYVLTGLTATTLVHFAAAREETIVESWIPVIGPWIMLADSAGFDGLQIAGTVISGILQAASLAGFVAGLVLVGRGSPDPASGLGLGLSGPQLVVSGRF